jgi:mRNA interferase RelE/StbE
VSPTPWNITVSRKAQRDIDKLPAKVRQRVLDALVGLTTHPRQGDIRKLEGRDDEYRLRVGEWRVIFRVEKSEKLVVVTAVRPRGGAYQA